ncbi:hypothetical protein [Carboxylicivirga sp. N1Y90]|uniref:hypothetical protein n=1 Tax=Carboxylicivirga fragile TaxID=3417571 RepID=UPI003D33695C|nr:hypothetical protein [Marinilabiliaceae bacterium N1Y90]
MKYLLIISLLTLLTGCLGLDSNLISDKTTYGPNVSLAVGQYLAQYETVDDLPIMTPVYGHPYTFSDTDTLAFNISDSFDSRENIVSILLQFDIINRFPADIQVKLYYIDENGTDIYLTAGDGIELVAAVLNEQGEVFSQNGTLTNFMLQEDQIDGLMTTDKVVVEVGFIDFILTPEIRANFNEYMVLTDLGVQSQLIFED